MIIAMGHNYRRPFYYKGVEWDIDESISDEEARQKIEQLFPAFATMNRDFKTVLHRY